MLQVVTAAMAAAPAVPNSWRVTAARSGADFPQSAAVPHIVTVSPSPTTCRYGLLTLPRTAAGDTLLQTAQSALNSRTRVTVSYSDGVDGYCTLLSIANAPGGTTTPSRTAQTAANAQPWAPFEGYHDPHAAAYKSAFRDFGQNKVDESVDPQTGKLSLRYVDVALPGPSGLDIKIYRSYSSPDPTAIATSMRGTQEPSFAGLGWNVFANFGGVRGLFYQGCTSYLAITGQYGSSFEDGMYFSIVNLPQWVHGDGRAETLVPTPNGWRTASGIKVSCGEQAEGPGNVHALLPDGTKVEMRLAGALRPIPNTEGGMQSHYYPTKVTDRWGNWIAITYHELYKDQVFSGVGTVASQPYALPIRQITASDGREVNFWYSTPRSPSSTALLQQRDLGDFKLDRIDYSQGTIQASIGYEYSRTDAGGSPLFDSLGKYFLTRALRADNLSWSYTYGAISLAALDPAPGEFILRTVTYPHNGVATYTWGASLSQSPIYDPNVTSSQNGHRALSNQVRMKATTDSGGVWRYSYLDMVRNEATLAPYDDIPDPVTGERITDLTRDPMMEATRVTGPDSVQVFYHVTRFPRCSSTNQGFEWTTQLPGMRAGRLFRGATFASNASFRGALPPEPMRETLYTYEPIYESVIKVLQTDQDVGVDCMPVLFPQPEYSPLYYHARRGSTEVRLGSRTTFASYWQKESSFSEPCGRNGTVASVGSRAKREEMLFGTYCIATSVKLFDAEIGGVMRHYVSRTLSADGKNVMSETVRGDNANAAGLTRSFTYHGTGERATVTDPRSFVSYFDFYKRGTPQQELHPVSYPDAQAEPLETRIKISRTVDDMGRVSDETDGEGRQTLFEYNGVHRPTNIKLPRATSVQNLVFEYAPTQDVITRGSRVETVSYDGFGRVTAYNNAGIVTRYEYDAAGRRKFVSYPGSTLGQRVSFDALDRPVTFTEPDPSLPTGTVDTSIVYDDSQRQITMTSPKGVSTTFTLESFGEPTEPWIKSRTVPEVGTMEVDRDTLGNVKRIAEISVADNRTVERTMVYAANQGYYMTEETHPERGTTYYVRDGNGNVKEKRHGSPAALPTTYTYDGQNRLSRTTPVDNAGQPAPAVEHEWYKTGSLKRVTANTVIRDYSYDDNNNLTQEAVRIDGVTRSLDYTYDVLDSLSSLTYPSGKVVSFNPDVLGRPREVKATMGATVSRIVTDANYWPSGMPKTLTYGNAVVQTFTEQRRPLVSALSIASGTSTLLGLGFAYDRVGNQLEITESTLVPLGYARSSRYDDLDRIKEHGTERFTYQGIGDLLTKSGANFEYGETSRKLQRVTGTLQRSYTYDGFGNATTDGRGFTYSYDALNALRSVQGNGVSNSYDYDGHQHMAKKVDSAGTTHFLYGKGGRLFGEYSIGASKSKEYFYLGNKLVGQVTVQ